MVTEDLRWKSECKFEYYCESRPNVIWVYKNGDSGLDYLVFLMI